MALSPLDVEAIADRFWARPIGGIQADEAVKILLAAMAGKLSGINGPTVRFRDIADTTDRISARVDSNGNRSAVTLDVS